jgi:hypothetical protein
MQYKDQTRNNTHILNLTHSFAHFTTVLFTHLPIHWLTRPFGRSHSLVQSTIYLLPHLFGYSLIAHPPSHSLSLIRTLTQIITHPLILSSTQGHSWDRGRFKGPSVWGRPRPVAAQDRLCGLVVGVPGYRSRVPGFYSLLYQIFWEVVGLERGPLRLMKTNEELLGRKNTDLGIRCADHATPSIRKVGTNFADKRRSLARGLIPRSFVIRLIIDPFIDWLNFICPHYLKRNCVN